MIITQLMGGLGNQMFQYSIGRVLSLKNNTELFVDCSDLLDTHTRNTQREYALDVFDLPVKIASQKILKKIGKPAKTLLYLNTKLNLKNILFSKNYFLEGSHNFIPTALDLNGDKYLSGYWQSEKYFTGYREVLLSDFSSRTTPLSVINAATHDLISSSNSVSIHIRRGDYISSPEANKFHGTCTKKYYQKAMELIENRVKNPVYFVFSDDISWATKNVKSAYKIYFVTGNLGIQSHEDMRLMSKCKHNIIANSSFSWWGAWLNNNARKIIISPGRWFKDNTVNQEDIIPLTWIRI